MMRRIILLTLVLVAGALLLYFGYGALLPNEDFDVDVASIAELYEPKSFDDRDYDYPAESRHHYIDEIGRKQVYLVQEPKGPADYAFIYMHGQSGDETEGMGGHHSKESFQRLRTLLAERGHLYVSPRAYDFDGIVNEIKTNYAPKKIYLIGISAGGGAVAREIFLEGNQYAGAILLCPAMPYPKDGFEGVEDLETPLWILSGADDGMIALVCRRLTLELQRLDKKFKFYEIPGGKHSAPLIHIDWNMAIDYITSL